VLDAGAEVAVTPTALVRSKARHNLDDIEARLRKLWNDALVAQIGSVGQRLPAGEPEPDFWPSRSSTAADDGAVWVTVQLDGVALFRDQDVMTRMKTADGRVGEEGDSASVAMASGGFGGAYGLKVPALTVVEGAGLAPTTVPRRGYASLPVAADGPPTL
jgi:hypothetical protein